VTGSGTATEVAIWSGGSSIGSSSWLDFDVGTGHLSVGEPTPSDNPVLNVYGSDRHDGLVEFSIAKEHDTTLNDENQKTYMMDYYTSGGGTFETVSTYTTSNSDYAVYYIKADFVTIDDRPDYGAKTLYGLFENSGGVGVNQIGTTSVVSTIDNGASFAAQFSTSGDNVLLQWQDDGEKNFVHVVYTVQKVNRNIP
jgi:hypothetical protein